MKQLDWFDFHERGNPNCPACATPPTRCQICMGLVHSHFGEEFSCIEVLCDKGKNCTFTDTRQMRRAAVGE